MSDVYEKLFNEVIPSYVFKDLNNAFEMMSNHNVFNEYSVPCDMSITKDGSLDLGNFNYKMSIPFASQLMRAIKLPKNNLKVLSSDRILADVNYRLDKITEDVEELGIRIFDQKAYDIYPVKKQKYLLPVSHEHFMDRLLSNMGFLALDEVKSTFDHLDGLRIRTKNSLRMVEIQGKKYEVGLELRNVDYNKTNYGCYISLHLYDVENEISIVGIRNKHYKIFGEDSDFLKFYFQEANRLLKDELEYVVKALQSMSSVDLDLLTLESVYLAAKKAVGRKSAEQVLRSYITEPVSEVSSINVNKSHLSQYKHYDLFNELGPNLKIYAPEKLLKSETVPSVIINTHIEAIKFGEK